MCLFGGMGSVCSQGCKSGKQQCMLMECLCGSLEPCWDSSWSKSGLLGRTNTQPYNCDSW